MAEKKDTKKASTKKAPTKKKDAKATTKKAPAVKKNSPAVVKEVVSEKRYAQLNGIALSRSMSESEYQILFEREIGGEAKVEKINASQVAFTVKGIRFPKEGHYTCK